MEPKKLFKNISHGKRVIREMLDDLPMEQRFEHGMLKALYEHHPTHGERHVVSFIIRNRPPYNVKSIFVIFEDGSEGDMYYDGCLRNLFGRYDHAATTKRYVTNTFRNEAFSGSRHDFYTGNMFRSCAICDGDSDIVVDHEGIPFCVILKRFCEDNNVDLCSVAIEEMEGYYRLKDRELAARWKSFHDKLATYRFLCKSCNTADALNAKRQLKQYLANN
jgi:hypothetical protein